MGCLRRESVHTTQVRRYLLIATSETKSSNTFYQIAYMIGLAPQTGWISVVRPNDEI